MFLTLVNHTADVVYVKVNDSENVMINVYQSSTLECSQEMVMTIYIASSVDSHRKKGKYILTVNTEYGVCNVKEGDRITIIDKKIPIEPNVFYRKMYLIGENIQVCFENNYISAEKKMKKIFHRLLVLRKLFISPFECFTGLAVFLLTLGVAFCCVSGWKILWVYLPSAYLILLLFDFIAECVFKLIKKGIKLKSDERKEFYSYFENNTITEHCSDFK